MTPNLQRHLHELGPGGASVAVLRDGEILLTAGLGRRDPSSDRTPRQSDTMHLYSIGKTFIAAAVLRLVEQGRLDLESPVSTWLPDLVEPVPYVPPRTSLRLLLCHASGLPDYTQLPAYPDAVRATPHEPWNGARFLAETLALPRIAPNGFRYSNLGYLVIRMVIERVTGLTLHDALQTLVFAPLGGSRLRVATTLGDVAGLAPGWGRLSLADAAPFNVSQTYHPGWVAPGAIIGRALDVALAFDGLMTDAGLSPESRAAMRRCKTLSVRHWLFKHPAYGLGLMGDASPKAEGYVGHGGGGPGFSTGVLTLMAGRQPRWTAAALANTEQNDLGLRLAWGLIRYAVAPKQADGTLAELA